MTEVIAHRGWHGDGAGENSLEAFQRAAAEGITRLETDVHRTRDGVLVALHDDTLDRTTSGAGPIAARSWPEIAELEVRGGGTVPRLADLLAMPDVGWVLDAKADDVVDPLCDALAGRGPAGGPVSVGTFDTARHARLRRRLPPWAEVAAGRHDVRALVAAARSVGRVAAGAAGRLLGALPRRLDVVQVPPVEGRTTVVDEAFVTVCHAAGLPVQVWTINTEEEMRRLLALGVDGLITDRPALALQVTTEEPIR